MKINRLVNTQRVETDYWVEVEGVKYDLIYLLNMLEEIESANGRFGGIEVFDKECEHLTKIKVLETCGNTNSYVGATPGKNFIELLNFLRKEMEKITDFEEKRLKKII